MPMPSLATRIEQACKLAAVGINPREVGSLVFIAIVTCERKIFWVVIAAMLPGDDVLDVEAEIGVLILVQAAVLATTLCPGPDQSPRSGIHQRLCWCLRKFRALACRIAMRLPN